MQNASRLEVEACGHTGKQPRPTFPTPEQLAAAQLNRVRMVVSRPAVQRASLPPQPAHVIQTATAGTNCTIYHIKVILGSNTQSGVVLFSIAPY